jgi:hypothetical protein
MVRHVSMERRANFTICFYLIHLNLVTRAFAFGVFVYPRFYFSVMRRIDILSAATVEAAAQAQ